MLTYCQLDPWDQTSVGFESKYKTSLMKMRLKLSSAKWRLFCPWGGGGGGGGGVKVLNIIAIPTRQSRWHTPLQTYTPHYIDATWAPWLFKSPAYLLLVQQLVQAAVIILSMGSDNERRRYIATPFFIGRAHIENHPWSWQQKKYRSSALLAFFVGGIHLEPDNAEGVPLAWCHVLLGRKKQLLWLC